jgi:hypothetical protein
MKVMVTTWTDSVAPQHGGPGRVTTQSDPYGLT